MEDLVKESLSSSATTTLEVYGGDLSELTPRDELLKILECPVCRDIPLPPIYNCSKGHTMCNKCRKKINKCPLCKSAFTESRNFVVESIVQTSKFICDYQSHGCKVILLGQNLQLHFDECEYRPFNCHLGRLDGCNDSVVPFQDYFAHLLAVHKVVCGREEGESTFVIRQTFTESTKAKHSWQCTYKKYDGNVFLTRSFKLGSMFYWSVGLIGTESQAAGYTVKITIERNKEDTVPRYELTIPVVSIRRTKAEIHQSLPHAVMPANLLKFFSHLSETEERKRRFCWQTRYEIRKVDQPDVTKS